MSFSLNPFFTNSAVFPHSKPIRIYGEADTTVKISFNGVVAEAQPVDGKWMVTLPQMECGGPFNLVAESAGESICLTDIYVGEVILVTGQSNAEMKLENTNEPVENYRSENLLRLFSIDYERHTGEHFKTKDGWQRCEKETAKYWTAIGYFMGQKLCQERGVAVGIIACYQGASTIQSWLAYDRATKPELFVPVGVRHLDTRHETYGAWNGDGFLYERMMLKVVPYAISRVVFYQGESNTSASDAQVYDKLLLEYFDQLRTDFCDQELPISIVQIADYIWRKDDDWKAIQLVQARIPELAKNVKTIPCADICEKDDIHPPSKRALAERIVDSF